MSKYKAIIDLGIDLARGAVTQFSSEEANETLRKAILDAIECTDGVFSYKKYRRNKLAAFEILEEILDVRLEEGIKNQFDNFVDYRSLKFGDSIKFIRENDDLFEIATIAGGTNNLRRQRLSGDTPFTIETGWKGVKIYEELERFLAGQVDWVGMINKVERSFTNDIANNIYTAIKAAYSGLSAPYYESGSWDIDQFNDVVAHVEAATGMRPIVIGTRKAVQKAEPKYITAGLDVNQRNQDGYFKTIDGITFGIMPQAHIPGTDTFAIDDDFLLILPNGNEKIIKFIMEGETLIKEVNGQDNADDSQEYVVRKKYGIAVEISSKYGVYILS